MLLIPARAKVNLGLAVRGRRADGFHDIDSVAVTIDWHDLVGVRLRLADATVVRLLLTGNDGSAPVEMSVRTRVWGVTTFSFQSDP